MGNMLSDIFVQNASNRKPGDGEYLKDGIIYCSQCNTPRETIVTNPFTKQTQKMHCICKCQAQEREAEMERLRVEEGKKRAARARKRCFGELSYVEHTFGDDDGADEKNSRRVKNYAEHFSEFMEKGQGLILFGGVGTGKSFHCACIANELLNRGYVVIMESVPTMVARIQRNVYNNIDPLSDAINADLLILDDLGAERGTEYAREQVYALIDGRYSRQKPFIISTNLTAQQLTNTDDITLQRIYGRILERCFPLHYSGKDRRRSSTVGKDMATILDM